MTNSVDPDQTAPRSSLFVQELSVSILAGIMIPYFFNYKTRVFFLPKHQALFSSKDKSKNIRVSSAAI